MVNLARFGPKFGKVNVFLFVFGWNKKKPVRILTALEYLVNTTFLCSEILSRPGERCRGVFLTL